MTFREKYGPWAIVAGSAEGLGEAYSTSLAKRGMNLFMVDNRSEMMRALAGMLESEYGIKTHQLVLDLSNESAANDIINEAKAYDTGLLIYNAAYSMIRSFLNTTADELENFISVNAETQLKLVHAFSMQQITRQRKAGIVMMSSLSGLMGMQYVATYAATKALVWNLAESLHYELKPKGIDILACIPGITDTPALRRSNPKFGFIKPAIMKPESVSEAALKALGRKTLFIPGLSNKLNYFILTRILPRRLASSIANRTMWNMYKHHN